MSRITDPCGHSLDRSVDPHDIVEAPSPRDGMATLSLGDGMAVTLRDDGMAALSLGDGMATTLRDDQMAVQSPAGRPCCPDAEPIVVIRLYVGAALAAGATIEASEGQAHYLGNVMRRSVSDRVLLFNGSDGEWTCRIAALSRGKAAFQVESLARPQADDADLWLVFGLLRRDSTDLVVQKATELGVSALLPAFTERTNAGRVNLDRLRAIATEAAEQSERLTIPLVHPPRQLHEILVEWPADRPLSVALERAEARPLTPASGPAGLLIGPEGGFGPRDLAILDRCRLVRPVSLGPRILRAETAAIAGLALLQAPGCG